MNVLATPLGALWTGRLPGPTYEPATEGSPGLAGFVATFLLALAVIALAVSFTRRMRRASHRDRLRADAAAAQVALDEREAAPDGVPDGTVDGTADGTADGTTGGTADGTADEPAGGAGLPADPPRPAPAPDER